MLHRFAQILLLLLLAACPTWAMADCPPDYPKGLPCPQEASETAWLEHDDRTARLKRLARGQMSFEFFSETISPAELGLNDFPDGLPVLRVVAGQDVFFDSGSWTIRPEAYPLLAIIASSLKLEPPDVTLFVAGHTDWDGGDDYNYDLGLKRAQSVAEALVRRGIYQASIYRVSFGELLPIASNETEAGKGRNRRVEFLFSAAPQAIVKLIQRQPIAPCAEEIGDEVGSCRRAIVVEATKVSIAAGHEQTVVDLAESERKIDQDKSLSPVEQQEQKAAIEQARELIPIDLSEERIPIDLTGQ